MLRCESVAASYGAVSALDDVTLTVEAGEIVALLGANGAGKTTTLKTIVGLVPLAGGRILFEDMPVQGVAPEALAKRGIALVPEGRRIFPGLTVSENLQVGSVSWRPSRGDLRREMDGIFTLFPRLRERRTQLGWSLSGGEQQMLAIGRALMSRPKLLLLDEPSLGLAPRIVEEVFRTIRAINQDGMTILLVEQNAAMALKTAHRGYILERGRVTMAGAASKLLADPEIVAAYLGA